MFSSFAFHFSLLTTKRSKLPVKDRLKRDRIIDNTIALFWRMIAISIVYWGVYYFYISL